jgi:valyl-tRNA synthetase
MTIKTRQELPKTYDHRTTEGRIYQWWESRGYFRPETQFAKGLASREQKPFVISMPPPNVTGELHLGHAITASLEDLMIRYHRMRGEPTLWVPGEDHAGIATQNVVERELAKEGLTRHDLGREKFVERVWEWVHKYRHVIADQHRRLGASCDWERERFTLDEGLSRAVREAFVRLYEKGLIYRGDYLINWCPRCETALSDLEVEHEEETGKLWHVRYPLVNEDWKGPTAEWGSGRWAEGATEFIEVATTRPETILGDTAVAVNPDDERYRAIVGRTAILPALGRELPIIADPRVDPEFGTGAVKITPGHDPNDYLIGEEHGLEFINVMNRDATINENGGPYAGMDRFAAREALVKDLEREGLLVGIEEEHRHRPGRCSRCNTLVEPLISTQWFVKTKPLAEPAIQAVRDGRIRIIPQRFEKVYFNWLENIRDWCISRQLWWGHRIPVWHCNACGEMTCTREDPTACAHCGSTDIHQDPDVLDTWFSSALWPFSTLGWPDDTEDLRYFYPTTVMETGYDILFFWVARMIMMGLEMTGDIPFEIVYLHGLIRDEKGRKMSKSMGNVIDPVVVMEEYGTDALRFTLLTGSSPGNDMKLAYDRIEGNRNFANKIWNAARFVISNLPEGFQRLDGQALEERWDALELPDRWILSRLNRLVAEATRLIDAYQFGEAGRQINDFFWGEFADWYIEIAKIRLYGDDPQAADTARQVLVHVLDQVLRLLHPYMPFITEEVWQRLPHEGEALIIASWPTPGRRDEQAERGMGLVQELVRAIRNARAEYNVEPARRIAAIVRANGHAELLRQQAPIITTLARVDETQLRIEETVTDVPSPAVSLVVGDGIEAYLPLAGMIDIARERERLTAAIAQVEAEIAKAERLLADEQFTTKAPEAVVQRERDKLASAQERLARLRERLEALG